MAHPIDLRVQALTLLLDPDPADKAAGVAALVRAHADGAATLDAGARLDAHGPSHSPNHSLNHSPIPGRPARPELVPPRLVGRRSMATVEGRAMLVHALAHIEFNAVNLALDAVWRFPAMPAAYYGDWLRVAGEEARHFTMLAGHLATLGHAYGDFPAHDSLWEMVAKTSGDVLARMALVPRTMEARGLDAIPPLRAKLAQAGDAAAAAILDVLLEDEVGHVEIGNRWYFYLCDARGLAPVATYDALTVQYGAPVIKGPFNVEARRRAGFLESELARYGDAAAETAAGLDT
jgi:uncharacterized ferritin-like protein (DUF455 family)